jgi:putative flippase GtrA
MMANNRLLRYLLVGLFANGLVATTFTILMKPGNSCYYAIDFNFTWAESNECSLITMGCLGDASYI